MSLESLKITELHPTTSKIPQIPFATADIVPKHPFRACFVGKTSSGKTNLMMTLLTKSQFYKNYFNQIYLFSGSPDKSFDELKLKTSNIFLDPDLWDSKIDKIIDTQEKFLESSSVDRIPRVLFVFEDSISHQKWLQKRKKNRFIKMHIAGRHYSISVMTTTQSWCGIPRSSRIQMDAIYYFRNPASERQKILDEYCPSQMNKKEFARVIVDDATRIKYGFLTIMDRLPEEEKFRKNLDQIYNI